MKIDEILTSGSQIDGTLEVFELESKLASYYGKKHCILMSNATVALFSCLISSEIVDSHVIVPSFGWPGSIGSLLHFDNRLSFVDIEKNYCIDSSKIEALIRPETKAILSIDTGGSACDSDAISKIAQANGLIYISDSAESLGAYRNGSPAGAFADVIIISFTKGKTINAGEMGAVLMDDTELFEGLIRLTQHPHRQKKVFGANNWFPFSPLNTRVHPFAAYIVNRQFKDIEQIISIRKNQGKGIIAELSRTGIIIDSDPLSDSTYFEYFCKKGNAFEVVPSKCSTTHQWYIEPDVRSYNLIELTQKFKPENYVEDNAEYVNEIIDSTLKIQFQW